MRARDSSGNQVSLLNDDSLSPLNNLPLRTSNYGSCYSQAAQTQSKIMRSYSNTSAQSVGSSPRTPALERSDSYDSNTTNDPTSPITPESLEEFERRSSFTSPGYRKQSTYEDRLSYGEYHVHQHIPPQFPMPQGLSPYDRREASVSEQQNYGSEFANGYDNRGPKRYPCRFKESHNCEKTFTTSGHASRHSKIHTAEKAVNCTYPGCQKKFTRADNMKQHLETHNKHSKDRSIRAQSSTPSKPALTRPAGIQKPSTSGRRSEEPSHSSSPYAVREYESYSSPRVNFSQINYPSVPRPVTGHTEASSGGLDALAAVAEMRTHG